MTEPATDRRRSSYADRLLAKTARSTLAERAELLEFRSCMYGPASPYADPDWVRWLYDNGPKGRSNGLSLWTFRDQGRIEGQQGALLTRVCVGDREYELAWAIDLMVSPTHRQRGVGAVLPDLVVEGSDVTGGAEVSEAARKSFRRGGWSHLGTVTQWVRVVDSVPFLKKHAQRLPARPLGWLANAGIRILDLVDRARALGRRLVPVERFDARADRVWERCGRSWPIIARRDCKWLSWRWDACPRRDGATAFWLEERGDTLGWVVVRNSLHHGEPAGFILDFLCRPEDLGTLLALSVQEMSKHEITGVYCLFSAPGVSKTLRSCGFLPRDSGFHVMMFAPKLPDAIRQKLADREQWFLTAGDSDLDRMRESTIYA